MQGSDLNTAAEVIAANVVSAYVHNRPGLDRIGGNVRDIAMAGLRQALRRVLPTDDGALLAAACNAALDETLSIMDPRGPRVETIDPDTGIPTMRAP